MTAACDLTDEPAVPRLAGRAADAEAGPSTACCTSWADGAAAAVSPGRPRPTTGSSRRPSPRFGTSAARSTPTCARRTAGRLAMVSSTAVARPLAGGANYAAVKAASRGMDARRRAGLREGCPGRRANRLRAASVIFRVKEPGLASRDAGRRRVLGLFADGRRIRSTITMIDLTVLSREGDGCRDRRLDPRDHHPRPERARLRLRQLLRHPSRDARGDRGRQRRAPGRVRRGCLHRPPAGGDGAALRRRRRGVPGVQRHRRERHRHPVDAAALGRGGRGIHRAHQRRRGRRARAGRRASRS